LSDDWASEIQGSALRRSEEGVSFPGQNWDMHAFPAGHSLQILGKREAIPEPRARRIDSKSKPYVGGYKLRK
jgi:hypothetical protein